EVVERVKEVALGGYGHQDVPFERLVEEMAPERSLSHTPLFQVMFGLQKMDGEDAVPGMRGVEISPFNVGGTTAKFDLSLGMVESVNRLEAVFEYNVDLFKDETIRRMGGHLEELLKGIVSGEDERVGEMQMLTEAERHQLLVEWNDTHMSYPELCLHEIFEEQAERTPDAVALIFEDERLSYRELNSRANQLAQYLRERGIGAESLVAVMLERSVEMVVALLGVLKAGGAYVPIDPEYPEERVHYMLDDSGSQMLLTHTQFAGSFDEQSVPVVYLDTEWEKIAKGSAQNVGSKVEGGHLAYVIYTSGTTGKPKGVMVEHRHLVNTLRGTQDSYKFTQRDVVPFIASFSFDIALFELFSPLLVGGTSMLLTKQRVLDIPGFVKLLEQITFIHTLPSLMLQIVDYVREKHLSDRFRHVRGAFVGGDLVPLDLPHKMNEVFPSAQIWIGYGPTEASIICANFVVPTDRPMQQHLIGRPLANVEIRVYDRNQQLVPVGVPGEIFIGGSGVTRGYLHRDALTKEKFVTINGRRFYRSGDVGRWRETGEIEFVGRTDEQVKVRGYRIELGEIEAVLKQHPGVKEVVVMAQADEGGDKRLVAYVVPEREGLLTVDAVREFLLERLPEYMVPAAFMLMSELPLTTQGKVNRRALPTPEAKRRDGKGDFVAPRDNVELQLTQIWEDVLGTSSIGIKSNFFDLGGHSLLAVRLMWVIEDRFGQKLDLSVLFQEPTIEHLAGLLRSDNAPASASTLVALQPQGTKRPFFCVHPGGGEVLCYYRLAQHLGEERPFYGLQAPSLVEVAESEDNFSTIDERAAAYIRALQSVQPEGPYLLGGWSFGGVVAFEMAQQLQREGHKVGLLALFDTVAPLLSSLPEDHGDAQMLAALTRERASQLGKKLELSSDELTNLEPEEQLNYVLDKVKGAGILSDDIREDLALDWMRRLIKGYRVRGDAYRTYTPQVYPGRITLFKANINPGHLKDEGMKEITALYQDPTYCWGGLSTEQIKIEKVPGYHEVLLYEPNVQVLAERLKACFDEAEAE
ncbi:MAG TPA: amino acid adenylation domain-containing protein, partial [Pyrinomonadaceae bacterium]